MAQSKIGSVILAGGGATRRLRRAGCRAAVLALLPLLGCAPPADETIQLASAAGPAAAYDPGPAPRLDASYFVAADGAALPLRKWLPKGLAKAVILGLHGFNDYGNAFDTPAAIWAEQGIATYAYDQRGFGAAPGRGLWAGAAALAADVAAAAQRLRAAYPGRPLYLVGESMGGAVAVVAMTGTAGTATPPVDGIVLSAPAVWGRTTMELVPKLALWAGVRMFPWMTLSGRGLGIRPSDNEAMLRILARDPMVLKGARVDTVYGLVNLMDRALEAAPRLATPTLLLYGAHDEIVPEEPIRRFVAELPPGPGRRLAYYADGYHMLLRDLEGGLVAADVASWVLDPQKPLPSQADRAAFANPHGGGGSRY